MTFYCNEDKAKCCCGNDINSCDNMYGFNGELICEECALNEEINFDSFVEWVDTDEDTQIKVYIDGYFNSCVNGNVSTELIDYCKQAFEYDFKNGSPAAEELMIRFIKDNADVYLEYLNYQRINEVEIDE